MEVVNVCEKSSWILEHRQRRGDNGGMWWSWRGSVQAAGARCPPPLAGKVMYQTACHARVTSKYACIFKECISGVHRAERERGVRGDGVHSFDILTRSRRWEQCVVTGHLASTLFIIHHPKKHGEGNPSGRGPSLYFSGLILFIFNTNARFKRHMVVFAKNNVIKIKTDNSCSKHRRSEEGWVILHPPVTVSLFHRENLEANMAEILILSPTTAAIPPKTHTPPPSGHIVAVSVRKTGKVLQKWQVPWYLSARSGNSSLLCLILPLEQAPAPAPPHYIQKLLLCGQVTWTGWTKKTTLLTLVKQTSKSSQLLKSSCKLHGDVIIIIIILKSRFLFKAAVFPVVTVLMRSGGAVSTRRYRAGFIVPHRCVDHGASYPQKPLFARCDSQRLQARGAHTHTHTNAHTRATRVRPLLSTSTRHLKAYRLVSGGRRTRTRL